MERLMKRAGCTDNEIKDAYKYNHRSSMNDKKHAQTTTKNDQQLKETTQTTITDQCHPTKENSNQDLDLEKDDDHLQRQLQKHKNKQQ
eukprot:4270793-Amphidinium_carterae.2